MNMTQSAQFWTSWQVAPEITLPLIAAEYLYLRQGLRNPTWASARERRFFLAGLLTIALVITSPIGVRSADLFWCHMIQHITLMMISGPLLVLGTPGTFRPKNKVFGLLTHPILSWVTYAALMIGVHLPGPHEFITNHPWAHTFVEVPLYIALPYLFYFNLLDRNLTGRRVTPAMSVIALFLMMVPETLTGFFIYVAPNSLYNQMFTLSDQRRGGSIMWSGGMIIDTVWMAFAVYHWIKSEERASMAVDLEIANEAR
ncbi:MAG TPA: cytochrome c oxidase assembly protein [Candidatus Paceibacterota bacterium]|nr:cytochrome c oxidase assembly protein [Candidatus Paceibacterota bacterium]